MAKKQELFEQMTKLWATFVDEHNKAFLPLIIDCIQANRLLFGNGNAHWNSQGGCIGVVRFQKDKPLLCCFHA